MTDKTPEGRKSDTMPLNMREIAEKIEKDYYSVDPSLFDLVKAIEQALIQVREETILECAEIAIEERKGLPGYQNGKGLRLKDSPVPISVCPRCKEPFEPFLRGRVVRTFLFIFPWIFGPSSCLICRACKEIVGYE